LIFLFGCNWDSRESQVVGKVSVRRGMESEPQSAGKDEVLSVELSAPSAWKKLVFSLSLSLIYFNLFSHFHVFIHCLFFQFPWLFVVTDVIILLHVSVYIFVETNFCFEGFWEREDFVIMVPLFLRKQQWF